MPKNADTAPQAEAPADHPEAPVAQRDPGLKSPDEWRDVVFPPTRRGPHPETWKHAAAESLHGWLEHAHHDGKPLALSRENYEKACEAATEPKGKPATYVPHPPALSQHAPFALRKKDR